MNGLTRRCLQAFLLALPLVYSQLVTGAELKSHPMLTAMPGFELLERDDKAFDRIEIQDFSVAGEIPGKKGTQSYEGSISVLKYIDTKEATSELAVFRNYQTALKKIGAVQLNSGYGASARDVRGGYHVFQLPAAQGGATVLLYINSPQWYSLTIIQPAALVQSVTASALAESIRKDGLATVQINFATGRAELPADAAPLIREIVALLKADRQLQLSIEGHTDNVGQAADNRKLSLTRAQNVAAAVAQGLGDPKRVQAVGHGADVPVADNRTEDGRARNRRVELVKRKAG